MTWVPTSPVTGGAMTGFTSPTYTLTLDNAPDSTGKQYAITAIGGTQAGVNAHSVAQPFTMTLRKPKVLKTLGQPSPSTGLITNVGRNNYEFTIRKGVLPLAGQPYQVAIMRVNCEIPAGSDSADIANLRAMGSLAFGMLFSSSSGIADVWQTGIVG